MTDDDVKAALAKIAIGITQDGDGVWVAYTNGGSRDHRRGYGDTALEAAKELERDITADAARLTELGFKLRFALAGGGQ